MRAAKSRNKSCADNRQKSLEFHFGDNVFLKVSPMKGMPSFSWKEKLSPRFIGPFEILERVGNLAYHLALPPKLAQVHNIFHITMLRKYEPDPAHVLNFK